MVLAALSPQRRTVTHFLRGWVAPVIRKVKVLCYRLTYYNCQICFVESEKLLLKWYLKSSSCCPFFWPKIHSVCRPCLHHHYHCHHRHRHNCHHRLDHHDHGHLNSRISSCSPSSLFIVFSSLISKVCRFISDEILISSNSQILYYSQCF